MTNTSPENRLIGPVADRLLATAAVGATTLGMMAVLPEAAEAGQRDHCGPHKQISFKLEDAKLNNEPDAHKYKLVAQACEVTKPRHLKGIRIVETDGHDQKKIWKFKRIEAGSEHQRYFKLPNQTTRQTIIAKAVDRRGHRLGKGSWYLNPPPVSTKSRQPLPTAKAPEISTCSPDPDFKVGIEDDAQFVWQKNISREKAFDMATLVFDAKILRIIFTYAQAKAYGYQQVIDTLQAARARGYDTQVTLTPTPAFTPDGDQTLNYINDDPKETESFAREAASALGNLVTIWGIYNEPNHPSFSNPATLDHYLPAVTAGENGILSVIPQAKIVIGDLAPNPSNADWLRAFQSVPAAGVSIHPYEDVINQLPELQQAAARPLYLSEYGVPASDPDQWNKDQAAIKLAQCAGVKELIFFQLVRIPGKDWNTGVINLADIQ